MIITNHAGQRVRQRVGLSKRALKRMISKIIAEGQTIEDMAPALRLYVQSKINEEDAELIRVWGNHIYLFKGEHLITVFTIPGRINGSKH